MVAAMWMFMQETCLEYPDLVTKVLQTAMVYFLVLGATRFRYFLTTTRV
ncbi:Uncharacterised protein [Chlamydia trachomatis]|nr:Uncharacterised protein [Chlamydia trachomatis]